MGQEEIDSGAGTAEGTTEMTADQEPARPGSTALAVVGEGQAELGARPGAARLLPEQQRIADDPDAWVSDDTAEAIGRAIPESTKRTYGSVWSEFTAFCLAAERRPLPASPETLAEYVRALARRGLAPASIQVQIAAIRTAHRKVGYPHQPDTGQARLVLRDHAKTRAGAGLANAKQAPPVSISALRAMVAAAAEHYADKAGPAADRDRLTLVLGLTMMARRSELAALNLADVRETDDGLEVIVRSSKTDQDAVGETVPIPHGRHADTDPVRLYRAWTRQLAQAGIIAGALLRGVDRHGNIGQRLSGAAVSQIVTRAATRAGLPDPARYTGHSLRAGGASESYRGGVAPNTIAKHGRWKENSPVVLGYIRAVDKWRDNPIHALDL